MADEEKDEKKESKQPIFILFKGDEYVIHYRSIKKWNKSEYFNGIRTVYTITLNHFDMEDTIIEYHDEKVRDAEYSNFMDKMRELDYIFM